MKDTEIYARHAAKSERESILDLMIANIKHVDFATLKQTVLKHINNYIDNTRIIVDKQKYIPSIFCTHGKSGLRRARSLKENIENTANDMQTLLDLISNLDGGNYNQGSLKTDIAKAFYELGTDKTAPNRVPGTRFSSEDNLDKSVGIIFTSSFHSHWSAHADINVVDFIIYVMNTLKETLSNTPVA